MKTEKQPGLKTDPAALDLAARSDTKRQLVDEKDIELVAVYAEKIMNGNPSDVFQEIPQRLLAPVLETAGMAERMNGSLSQREKTPEALMAVVERSLKDDPRKEEVSVTVRLTEAGLRILQSFTGSMELKTALAAQTRRGSAQAPVRETSIHLLGNAGQGSVEYNLHRTAETEIRLDVVLKSLAGNYTIHLKKDKRTVQTQKANGREGTVSFSRLSSGHYEVEVNGHYPQKITVDII